MREVGGESARWSNLYMGEAAAARFAQPTRGGEVTMARSAQPENATLPGLPPPGVGPSTPIANQVFDRCLPLLSGGEMKVLMLLISHAYQARSDQCSVSRNALAELTGLCISSVSRAIRNLTKHGLITVRREQVSSSGSQANTYILKVPNPFAEERQGTADGNGGKRE